MWCRTKGRGGHVSVADIEAVGAEPGDSSVHGAGVEEHQGVEDQAERADLGLHAVLVVLVELPGARPWRIFRPSACRRSCRSACVLNCRRYPGS